MIQIDVAEPSALGAEFPRWEIATAVAGAILGIDPFDQPNVQQAKDATQVLLGRYKTTGQLPVTAVDVTTPGRTALTLTRAARTALHGAADAILTLDQAGRLLSRCSRFSLRSPQSSGNCRRFAGRSATGRGRRRYSATGHVYLHSTGQLHKVGRTPASSCC